MPDPDRYVRRPRARLTARPFWPGRCKRIGRVDVADRTFELVLCYDCLIVFYKTVLFVVLYNKFNITTGHSFR